jgi:Type II CAAX prenyl endopeptidase Rce1-like
VALCTNNWSYSHSFGEQYASGIDRGRSSLPWRIFLVPVVALKSLSCGGVLGCTSRHICLCDTMRHATLDCPYYFMASSTNVTIFPLVLTAISPTLCRIFRNTYGSLNNKTSAILAFCTFILPCVWLWGIHQSNVGFENSVNAIFTAVLLSPTSWFLSQWPKLSQFATPPQNNGGRKSAFRPSDSTSSPSKSYAQCIDLLIKGGPLGYGCHKVIQVALACLLWVFVRGFLPPTITDTCTMFTIQKIKYSLQLSNIHGWIIACLVFVAISLLSLVVNFVLWNWSFYYPGKNGTHDGLNSMLKSTMGRSLNVVEHIQLVFLAVINATCEELICRGFWRYELELTARCTKSQSNILQGMIFGVWHYSGIPSGWIGVLLTTVYGWAMGFLSDWNVNNDTTATSGLLLPIITHSIADYYIFTVLARQNNPEKQKK